MEYLNFIFQIVVISLTGVMLPGPMTAVALSKGSNSPHNGLLMSIGHGIVEIPLIILIFLGFGFLFQFFIVKLVIGISGSIFLFITGISMFIALKNKNKLKKEKTDYMPIISGIVLSAGNPLFFIWWITVGNILIFKSYSFGLMSFIIFIILHLSCDALWLYFLSFISYKGGRFFGNVFQKVIFAICGILLLFFGGKYLYDTIKILN